MFGIGTGIGSSIVGTVIGFFTGTPLAGLVIGVVVGMVVLVVFAVQAVKVAVAGNPAQISGPPQSTVPSTTRVRDDAFAEANRIAQRIQPDSGDERLRDEIQRLRDENERLQAENEQYASQPDAGQLKERCLTLSGELFGFADKRDETDPEKRPDRTPGTWARSKEQGPHDDETKKQYGQRFAGRVAASLDAAERRDWISSEERKTLEGNIKSSFRFQTPTAYIREMAQRLEAFGHRL